MDVQTVTVQSGDAPDLESFLAVRIYEHNSRATGYFDAESFSAAVRDDAGEIQAGIYGFTWGACCFVSYLWVSEALRGRGLGSELLDACERHALMKHCKIVLLSSHSFQAPDFYSRKGYKQEAVIEDYPVGYADIFFSKRLGP